MRRHLPTVAALAASALLSACGGGIYDLPTPPPEDNWKSTSLIPGEDERGSQKRYLDARAAALELYAALKGERWDEAWELLSSETRSTLAYGSPEDNGKAALEEGELTFPDGTSFQFDPTSTLIIDDLRTFTDEVDGQQEAETDRRKEIYAVNAAGDTRKLVMIYETGKWRLHRTKVP